MADNDPTIATRRRFLATAGAAAAASASARSPAAEETAAEETKADTAIKAIDFPRSFLYCSPTDSGIWVRVQIECRGCLTETATGETDDYLLGVVARTGLTRDSNTGNSQSGRINPGYDYWIIFSKTHVFTKRSHTSAYFNNPTVLEHADFGEAKWRLRYVPAEPLKTALDVRRSLQSWRELTAQTTFTSDDGKRQFRVEYPVKWADFMLKREGFRIETGPVFLLDPDNRQVGEVPAFEDFQWAHFDYRSFEKVRCLLERPTSIFEGANFTPPAEDGRQQRKNPALTADQVEALRAAAFSAGETSLSRESVSELFSTDHYSQAREIVAATEIYALAD